MRTKPISLDLLIKDPQTLNRHENSRLFTGFYNYWTVSQASVKLTAIRISVITLFVLSYVMSSKIFAILHHRNCSQIIM